MKSTCRTGWGVGALALAAIAGPQCTAGAQTLTSVKTQGNKAAVVWAMPPGANNGQAWRELFDHPDQWAGARSRIAVLGYADHNLASQFTDAELRGQFTAMKQWNLKLGLEVGAVKEWGQTGAIAFAKSRKNWDRMIADGAQIDTIAMDEPLACTVNALKKPPLYAVEETAAYIGLVRKNYPDWKIGDIEPYPAFPAPLLLAFLDALQARLAQMHVRGLDFFRLDVDWMNFVPGNVRGADGWSGVRDLQQGVQKRGVPFSLVYWAADYPSLSKKGQANDMTWEKGIFHQGDEYRHVKGAPDDYVIESWVGAPPHAVPETEPGTFMHSVDAFTTRFVPGQK